MKKIFRIFSILALTSLLFSCADGLDARNDEVYEKSAGSRTLVEESAQNTTISVHVLYAPGDSLVAWSWAKYPSGDANYKCDTWANKEAKGLIFKKGENQFDLTYKVDNTVDLGILFVSSAGQTADIIIPKAELTEDKHFYFIYGQKDIYDSATECKGLKNASIVSKDGNTLNLVVFGCKSATKDSFTVTDKTGAELTIASVNATDTSAKITLTNGDVSKRPYFVTLNGSDTVSANISSDLIDELELKYTGDDLGVKISGSSATFKVWAPSASKVSILFYDSVSDIGTYKALTVAAKANGGTDEEELKGSPSETQEMAVDNATGVWSYELSSIGSKKYYKYQIEVDGKTLYVCDINAKVCAPDSIAAQIVDINDSSATPSGWGEYENPFKGSTYNDAVIYEMHIRDWSRATEKDSTGKFKDFASDEVIAHLKDLGVTHVQILPMFDYAQVNADENYNWGYNPYHYNVPEGRYVDYSSDKDGTAAVKQLREMIQKLHDNGISVIMDVVYNHTSGTTTGSLYDSTVPGYFYRLEDDGNYINGSGCGNEIATNHEMAKKYVIDSLKHWMQDYHINGFRFDLMGCLESETMKEIYDELYKIDPNVMVYGEPWTGGTSGVVEGASAAVSGSSDNGVGAFDDDFRDAIKGAEFGGFNIGQIQSANSDSGIVKGLIGESGSNNRNSTGFTGLALHYAECHDNFTLYDKLVYSLDITNTKKLDSTGNVAKSWPASVSEEQINLIKKQNKLAAAYIFLSQGTPFINGGQEFMRTKKGDPDSYAPDTKGGIKWTSRYNGGTYVDATDIDDVNSIDLSFKTKYADVYNTYKGLISLRKSSTAFTAGTSSTAKTLSKGVTLYNAKSDSEEYEVIFNASENDYVLTDVSIEGNLGLGIKDYEISFGRKGKRVTISEETGEVTTASEESVVSTVPAKSFVILKK
ncbi:MAG: alpha-amylase family glycosyl hydrolase [Treponema porcinum]|uniref:alpha-amylase family glycosyl hydrolase n=2 Tax=Treponema porcinum TaxID=261392 RepID=UPI00240A280F|nr:alpha-amylase family glycosyl hydrolase [Treponema porcinum]MDD6898419.1 alpha-amylase family glycosyl hydrolase [Treponema porcinum]